MLQEDFPRPDFVRPRLRSLNGRWDFEIANEDTDIKEDEPYRFYIEVPYLPHTNLSGLSLNESGRFLWYRIKFNLSKADISGGVLLNFGAIFGTAYVILNGQVLGANAASYTPFAFNITDFVSEGENILIVKVIGSEEMRAKEKIGIWQNVWLEFSAKTFIENVHAQGSLKTSSIFLQGKIANITDNMKVEVSVYHQRKKLSSHVYKASENIKIQLQLAPPIIMWNPLDGHVYDIKIILKNSLGGVCDTIYTYCAFREVSIVNNALAINGKPVFLRQVRIQCTYPDSKHTITSTSQIKQDCANAMTLGFNGLYFDNIVPDPRYLYIADQLGLLVTVSFNREEYNIESEDGMNAFLHQIDRVLVRDYRHPSIVIWSPLNDYFGNKQPSQIVYDFIRRQDSTRLISSTAGGYQYYTDIYDKSINTKDYEEFKESLLCSSNGPILTEKEEAKLYKSNPDLLSTDILFEMPLYVSKYSIYELSSVFGNNEFEEEDFLFYYCRYNDLMREAGAIGSAYALLNDSPLGGYGLYDLYRNIKLSNKSALELRKINLRLSKQEKDYLEEVEKKKKELLASQEHMQPQMNMAQPQMNTIYMPPINNPQ